MTPITSAIPLSAMPPRIAFASRRASSLNGSSMGRSLRSGRARAPTRSARSVACPNPRAVLLEPPALVPPPCHNLGAVLLEHPALVLLEGVVVDQPEADEERHGDDRAPLVGV